MRARLPRARLSILLSLLLCAGVTAGLLCGCGKSAATSASTETVTKTVTGGGSSAPPGTLPPSKTPTSPTSPSKVPSRAQALAFARSVNLTAADLPGFKASREKESESPRDKHVEAELARCTGTRLGAGSALPSGEIASLDSDDFTLQRGLLYQSVSSSVTVVATPTIAGQELQAVRSPRGRRCIARALKALVATLKFGSHKLGHTALSVLPASAPGTDGAFGFRLQISFELEKVQVPFYLDFIGFSAGRAEVILMAGTLLHAPTSAAEQSLVTRLADRVKNHPI